MLYLNVPILLNASYKVVWSAVQCTKKYALIIPNLSIHTVKWNWTLLHLFERIHIVRIDLRRTCEESSWRNILKEEVPCVQDTSGFLFYKVSCAEYFGKLQFGFSTIKWAILVYIDPWIPNSKFITWLDFTE